MADVIEHPVPHTEQSRAAAFVEALKDELKAAERYVAGAVTETEKAAAAAHKKLVEAEIAAHQKIASSKG